MRACHTQGNCGLRGGNRKKGRDGRVRNHRYPIRAARRDRRKDLNRKTVPVRVSWYLAEGMCSMGKVVSMTLEELLMKIPAHKWPQFCERAGIDVDVYYGGEKQLQDTIEVPKKVLKKYAV